MIMTLGALVNFRTTVDIAAAKKIVIVNSGTNSASAVQMKTDAGTIEAILKSLSKLRAEI